MTRGLVDAWLLELADLGHEAVTQVVAAYVALRTTGDASTINAVMSAHAPHGLFTGHLHQGSRELDAVAGELTES